MIRTSTNIRTMADSLVSRDDVLAIATKYERICPLPKPWNRRHEMLPGKSSVGAGWEPALPLILAACHDSRAAMKL